MRYTVGTALIDISDPTMSFISINNNVYCDYILMLICIGNSKSLTAHTSIDINSQGKLQPVCQWPLSFYVIDFYFVAIN